MSREPSGQTYYIRTAVWQLVQDGIEVRRRNRVEDPAIFQGYARTLLHSVCAPEEAL